ncbi:MAG: helix-turn-helix domain-containing protein [Patescibacteria group bacterium]
MSLDKFPLYLNIKQTAEILGLHPDTLRNWGNTGRLNALRLGKRGDRRWLRENILEIIEKGLD